MMNIHVMPHHATLTTKFKNRTIQMLAYVSPRIAHIIVSKIWGINTKTAAAIVSAEEMAMAPMVMLTARMVIVSIFLPVSRRMSAAEPGELI